MLDENMFSIYPSLTKFDVLSALQMAWHTSLPKHFLQGGKGLMKMSLLNLSPVKFAKLRKEWFQCHLSASLRLGNGIDARSNATLITSIKVSCSSSSYRTYNKADYGGSLNKMSSNSHFTVLPNLCFICSCSPWNNAEMVASGASDSTRATPTSSGP